MVDQKVHSNLKKKLKNYLFESSLIIRMVCVLSLLKECQ